MVHTIEYEEIFQSERTGKPTTKHLWKWDKDKKRLSHFIDGEFEDEFTGTTAEKILKTVLT